MEVWAQGRAEPERDEGARQDRELEAAVGVDSPILAPFWITGACCGAQCMGEHPCGFSDAEAQGWLGNPLGPSGPLWGHRGPALSHARPLSRLLRGVHAVPGGTQPVGPYLDLLTLGKGRRNRNLGKKMGFGVIFLLVSQSCSPASLPTMLMMLQLVCVPPLSFQCPGDPGVKPQRCFRLCQEGP